MNKELNQSSHVVVTDKESIENITPTQLRYANTLKIYDNDDVDYTTLTSYDLILIDKTLTNVIGKLKELNFKILDKDVIHEYSKIYDNVSLETFLNTDLYDPKQGIPILPNNVRLNVNSDLLKKFESQLKQYTPNIHEDLRYFNGDTIKIGDNVLYAMLYRDDVENVNNVNLDCIKLNGIHLYLFELNASNNGTDNLPVIKFKSHIIATDVLKPYPIKVD
jgi:hypothetical protein